MKKLLTIFILSLTIICMFTLVACGAIDSLTNNNSDNNSSKKPIEDAYANHKQVLALIKDYSVSDSNGYDYSLQQKYLDSVINEHDIQIRIDNSDSKDIIVSRYEYTKELNEDINKGLYTEACATSYYNDEKIATYVDDEWVWEDGNIDEFYKISINAFSFELDSLTNVKLDEQGDYSLLTFSVSKDKSTAILKTSNKVDNLKFAIITSKTYDKIISFSMSYSQDMTSTSFTFTPYYSSVEIALPE